MLPGSMKIASTLLQVALCTVLSVIAIRPLAAATSAYWRHEEGPAGGIVPDGPDTVLDSSDNGNHMETYSSGFEPFTAATYSSVVSPLPLRSGLPNALSLDFGATPTSGIEDGGGRNDDNYTEGKPVQTQLFTSQTIELAFRMHSVGNGARQAVFGKDGKPLGDAPGEDDSPVPAFKVFIRNDDFPGAIPNQIFVEWVDGDGTLNSDVHFLSSGFTTVPDQWYHLAITRTATDAELWIAAETGPYELVDAISGADFAGPDGRIEVAEPAAYSIGRGMFDNAVADWADALIDEVRISDVALTPDQFLFVAAEDPGQAGDFDGDGDVDGNDFLVFQRGVPTYGMAELNDIKNNFGAGGAVAAAGAIPEPSTSLLAAFGVVGAATRRRKREKGSDLLSRKARDPLLLSKVNAP